MHVHRQDRHLERRNRIRPDNTAIVKVLLNRRRHHASDPDTIATHGQDLVAAIFALNRGFHRLGVLRPQLEDMTHFDTALDKQGTFAVRARIAGNDVTEVSDFRRGDIAVPVDAEIVFAVDVGAGGEIAHHRHSTVNNHRHRQVHRTQGARTGFHQGADLFFGGEGQRAGDLRQFFRFHFVQLVIAAHQQGNQRGSAIFNRFHQQGFHGFFDRQVELLNQLGDGFGVRRVDQGQLLGGVRARRFRRNGFRKLDVCRVVGAVGEDHIVFAALRQHLEFMRGAAADGAGISLYRAEIQPHTAEDFAVSGVHRIVGFLQRFLRSMERVRIFHQEFAGAHHAETRAHFVAEFGLDLIEVQRQLLIGVQLVADQIGDDLFVGWTEDERTIATIGNAQQFRAVLLPATALLPQFRWLNDRH